MCRHIIPIIPWHLVLVLVLVLVLIVVAFAVLVVLVVVVIVVVVAVRIVVIVVIVVVVVKEVLEACESKSIQGCQLKTIRLLASGSKKQPSRPTESSGS